jgi:vitamin B12 transporter
MTARIDLRRRAAPVLLLSALALPASTWAAGQGEAATSGKEGVDEVIVVATRLPVGADKVGNSVSVLAREAIEESQAVLTSDLLATLPGVGVTRNGGPGTATLLRIRGAESDHTLVLIDGVQINDPSSPGGGFDLGNLLVGDTDRIEVMRGSQSTLYGSQAIGGVVNIVSTAVGEEPEAGLLAEYGSMNSSLMKAGMGGRLDRLSARVAGAWYSTDGISTYADGVEDDGFHNTTFSARLGYDFTEALALDLRAYYADGKSNYDGFPPPYYTFGDSGDYSRTRQLVGYAGVDFALAGGRLQNRLAYQYTDSDRQLFSGAIGDVFPAGNYDGRNQRYEYQGSWNIATGYSAVFGLQRETSDMHSQAAPEFAEARMDSAYVQLQAEVLPGLTLTAGDRHDDHDAFGSHNSAQLAAAWLLPTQTVLRASWGEGFKAPTLYQLYSDYANPSLQPETSSGWDAGIEQRLFDRRLILSATWFERSTRDQINFVSCPFPLNSICSSPGHSPWGFYENIARTEAQGLELEAVASLSTTLSLTANYTRTKAVDRSPGSATFDEQLLRRPRDMANATLTWKAPFRLTSSVALRYASSSDDMNYDVFPEQRVALDAYTLVDLRLAFRFSDALEFAGRVENLLDEAYTTVYRYGTTGRAGYLSLQYSF